MPDILIFCTNDEALALRDEVADAGVSIGFRNAHFFDKRSVEKCSRVIMTREYDDVRAAYEAADISVSVQPHFKGTQNESEQTEQRERDRQSDANGDQKPAAGSETGAGTGTAGSDGSTAEADSAVAEDGERGTGEVTGSGKKSK